MTGADDPEIADRWLKLVHLKVQDEQQRNNLIVVAISFAMLTNRNSVWDKIMDQSIMTESPLLNRYIEQTMLRATLKQYRETLLSVLKAKFGDKVTEETQTWIEQQTDLDSIKKWIPLAATANSWEAFVKVLRG